LSIVDQDVPLDYAIHKLGEQLAPAYRAGAVVRFPVTLIRTFTGRLVVGLQGEGEAPSYGSLTVTLPDRVVESPLSKDGDFYLENVGMGDYPASAVFGGGRCTFQLEIPKASTLLTNLGAVRCEKIAEP
jgi:outer membrane usher protein